MPCESDGRKRKLKCVKHIGNVSLERIEITPFAVIVGDILQERRTGNLTVIRPPLRKVLYWSQILAGALTVPILVFILLVSNDRRVMRTTNSWWQNFWIGASGGAIVAAVLIVFWWKISS